MVRRILAFFLILMLLFSAVPSLAEREKVDLPTFFMIVDRYEGVDYPMGTAVLFGDQSTLLSSIWSTPYYGEIIAIGPDGEYTVTGAMTVSDTSEAALLDIEPVCTAGKPAQLYYADADTQLIRAMGYDADGKLQTVEIGETTPVGYGGSEAVLMVSETPLLTGAIILDDYNRISGLLLAIWNELPDRYVALPHATLVSDMLGSEVIHEKDGEARNGAPWRPNSPQVSLKDGRLQIDWSAHGYQEEEIASYTLFFADTLNYHYSYLEFDDGSTSTEIPVVPGRSYIVWIDFTTVSGQKPLTNPERYHTIFDVPVAPALTAHGFRHVSAWLASLTAEEEYAENASVLPAMEEITAEKLSDPNLRLFIQVENTYQVSENIEADLMIALTTPDNLVFSLPSGYIFMPELNAGDAWNAEVTSLFQDCLNFSGREGFAPGRYSLDYYIGGEYAGGTAFVLK